MANFNNREFEQQRYTSAALEKSNVVVTTKAKVLSVFGFTGGASGTTYYVQLFDSATVPADTTVPSVAPILTTGSANFFSIDFAQQGGLIFNNGISFCLSTSGSTKTQVSSNLVFLTVVYENYA